MNLVALPAVTDNCIWMLHDQRSALEVGLGACHLRAMRRAHRARSGWNRWRF